MAVLGIHVEDIVSSYDQPDNPFPQLPQNARNIEACCHTLILDLKILTQISLLFSNAFKSTVFSTVRQRHILSLQSFKFFHKIIPKGILVISHKGIHFSPYNLSLSLFCLFA